MNTKLSQIRGCVFDAYGTLFDVNSAARLTRKILGNKWKDVAELWRTKQLQYTWLRTLAGRHANFWQVTGDALDFALDSLKLANPKVREELMDLYLRLSAYPEVKNVLAQLKASGFKCAVLSNGSPNMLTSAIENAGIQSLLDAVLSVEDVQVYKPLPAVYQLAKDRLVLDADEICYISSNGWDAYSAKAFGFYVVWCNRFGQVPERIPTTPDAEIKTLSELPELVGLR